MDTQAGRNTDRELWRERPDDHYADSIHFTESGDIGIKCGGTIYVKPVREWHRLAERAEMQEKALHTIVPKLIDALRNAADVDSGDVYEILGEAGIIRHVFYDPEKHGEIEDAEPGAEVWVFTDFGDEFAGKEE